MILVSSLAVLQTGLHFFSAWEKREWDIETTGNWYWVGMLNLSWLLAASWESQFNLAFLALVLVQLAKVQFWTSIDLTLESGNCKLLEAINFYSRDLSHVWKWLFCLSRQNSGFPLFGLGFELEFGLGLGLRVRVRVWVSFWVSMRLTANLAFAAK